MYLDTFPFVVMILLALSRCGVISVRYATTHKLILEQMNYPTMTREAYRERLMRLSWITMPPEVAMHEVDMGMIRVGTNSRFFKFKTLSMVLLVLDATLFPSALLGKATIAPTFATLPSPLVSTPKLSQRS